MTLAAAQETDKKVSWAELFFDLVFVIAITRVSQLLGDDHSWGRAAQGPHRVRPDLLVVR